MWMHIALQVTITVAAACGPGMMYVIIARAWKA